MNNTIYRFKSSENRNICSWIDLNASYDIDEQFTVYTKIRNLGNRKFGYDDLGGLMFERPGRYYMLGATYKF